MLEQMNRKLGGLELLFYAWDQRVPKHHMLAARIEGITTVQSWKKALISLQRRHPMLRVGISHNHNEVVFSPTNNPIPLEIRSYTVKTSIQMELQHELARPVRIFDGPLLRVVLLHNEQGCFLIVSAHHSVADGLSLVYLVNDILKAVTGSDLDELPLKPSLDELLNRLNGDLFGKAFQRIDEARRNLDASAPKPLEPQIDVLTFSRDLTDRIIARSKAEQTTVHATLQAAAVVSIASLVPANGASIRVMSPISPREHLEVSEQCGLYTIAATLGFDESARSNFWELSRRAKEDLSPWFSLNSLEGYTDGINGLVANTEDPAAFIESNLNFEIMLSNLGRFPFANVYGPLTVKNLYGPMIISGPGAQQAIGATSIDGQLNLTNSSLQIWPTLLTDIRQRLKDVCE